MGLFHHRHEAEAAEKKVKDGPADQVTHELLAGAAGAEALRMYEKHLEKNGVVDHHKVGKELLAGFAAGTAEKYIEKGIYAHLDKEKVKKQAQDQAEHIWTQEHPQDA
jgi:hypothetical protein